MVAGRGKAGADASRRYGPMMGLLAALALVVAVLPSSLNLPQSNPTTTPEFAPVPPSDQKQPPPVTGNFAGVGLASGTGVGGSGPGGAPTPKGLPGLPPGTLTTVGKTPSTKDCVGNPPRQTEDALAPPCVAYYEGNNGGPTYAGVTGSEVRVVVLNGGAGGQRPTSQGTETAPTSKCFDLGKPANGSEDVTIRVERRLQTYFNHRYQTYKRFVRLIACFGRPFPPSPESRRADASDHFSAYHPYAFVNLLAANGEAYTQEYDDVMLRHGVMKFASRPFLGASQLQKFAPLVWNYAPSIEIEADKYASFVCSKVVKRPVSFSGNTGENGQPRVLGLLHVEDPGHPELSAFTVAVRRRIEACGGVFKAEGTYKNPYSVGATDTDRPQAAAENIATFRTKGVTTIIWTGGWEEKHTKAAASVGYRPEWIMASDGEIDYYGIGQVQEPTVWAHAWIVSELPRYNTYGTSDKCYLALREVDPSFPEQDARFICALGLPYEALRQLFTGIQLAGPTLTPVKVEEGFRAIPPRPSSDPATPSCFYNPGDYTCVKDAQASWWDSTAKANNNRAGCWKLVEGGKRYLAGHWPAGDVTAQRDIAHDVCNGNDPTFLG